MYDIGILVFDEVEELDFVGPFETLSSVEKIDSDSIKVTLIAKSLDPVKASNGLRVLPDKILSDDDRYDVLIVPGGQGRKQAMKDEELLDFIKDQVEDLDHLCSVCTGAFILAEAGILNGLKATTHKSALDELKHNYPDIQVLEKRVVKNGTDPDIWTAAGISSGIDMSLELIRVLFDEDMKDRIAERLEYEPRQ